MPMLRCTNEDCAHTWFERSMLADGADCEQCGDPAVIVDDDDLLDDEPAPEPEVSARRGQAREMARQLLAKHGITKPFVDVFGIAGAEGFEVRVKQLPEGLSGRLVGNVIEVNSGEAVVRQRFTVAHELGHHAFGTTHGLSRGSAQRAIEQEADAFAGELLVPGPMLRERGTSDAAGLRRAFRVSRPVLKIAAEVHGLALTGDV
jgi:IrrE N-terminal-like domain